jgi:branched-chain amino acid transport system permease protein
MRLKSAIRLAALALAVVLAQLAVHWAGRDYLLTPLTMSTYYALVVIGLSLLMGYAGQISLGHAAFFAIGGYTTAKMTTLDMAPHAHSVIVRWLSSAHVLVGGQDVYGDATLAFDPRAAAFVAILVACLVAYMIGVAVLRLKGHYLAMATLGCGIIVHTVVKALEALGGADGISNVPTFPLFAGLSIGSDLQDKLVNYYLAWALTIAGLMVLMSLVESRVGRALRAIHGSEEAAEAVGVDTARLKRSAFVLSAAFAAAAGVFLTHYNGGIGPSEAGVMKSVRYVAIVAVGGSASLWGCLIMALLLNFLSLRGYFGSHDNAVFGGILIAMMMLGQSESMRRAIAFWRRRSEARP